MTCRPRSSLLNLFDPLLAEAIRVPIPESPPSTPRKALKPLDCGPDNKENVVPKELTMSVFFNRISHVQHPQTYKDGSESSLLVDFEDAGAEPENEIEATPSRKPLAELSVEDLTSPTIPRIVYRPVKEPSMQDNNLLATPTSVKRTSPFIPYPLPTISVSDSSKHAESTFQSTSGSFQTSPSHHKGLQPTSGPASDTPHRALMPPPSSSNRTQQRRRSSLDNSMALSMLSCSSFHIPDASFDLVNGEISFLSNLEDEDVNEEVLFRHPECETPMIRIPSQKMIAEESPLESSGGTENLRGWSQTPSNSISGGADDNNNDQSRAPEMSIRAPSIAPSIPATHSLPTKDVGMSRTRSHVHQRTLSTVSNDSTATVRDDVFVGRLDSTQTPRISPVSSEGQDTPLRARRLSSVPAPTKKLRVFTSNHHKVAMSSTIQSEHKKNLELEDKPIITRLTKPSKAGSSSGIPIDSKKVPIVRNKPVQHNAKPAITKQPLSANQITTNIGAPAPRPTSSSMLRKPNAVSNIQRTSNPRTATSRLPGPVASRDSSLPKLASASRLPAPPQRIPRNLSGRSVPATSVNRFPKA